MFSNNSELLIKLINGASNILSTTKKVIPIYNDIKPLFSKIKNLRKYLSNFNFNIPQNNTNKKEAVTKSYTSSNPKFFI